MKQRWPRQLIVVFLGWLSWGSMTLANGVSVSPSPDKLLYKPGETASIEVTLKNNATTPFEGKLRVQVIWEMEDTKLLLEQPVKLGVNETNVIMAKWEKAPEVLGCEARAELVGTDGKVMASAGEYFNVCSHLDVMRVGIHQGQWFLFAPSTDRIRKMKQKEKEHYINIVEYMIGSSHVWSLAPTEDLHYCGPLQSVTAVRTAIEEGHKVGQKATAYVTSYTTHGLDDIEVSLRHPEWLAYDKLGQPFNLGVDVRSEDRLRTPLRTDNIGPGGAFCSGTINFMNQAALDYHIGQLIANHKLVGMDGVRYDGEPGSQWGDKDIDGKPFPDAAGRARERIRMIKYIRERLRKEIPSYLFMFNAGRAVGLGNPVDLKNGVLAPDLKPIVEEGGGFCDEEQRGAFSAINEFNNWKKYADVMVSDVDLTRKEGGYAYELFPWPSTVHKNADEIGYSILLAAGDHPWFCYSGDDDAASSPEGTHYPIQRELYAFATRFSAMLWGKGIERIREPNGIVEVKSEKGEIWWENFVHQRVLADGQKYITVHLLNAPPNKTMGVIEQPMPEPIKNIQVQFKVPVKKVWLATARPGPAKVITLTKEQRSGGNWRRAPSHEEYGPMQYGEVKTENGKVIVPELRMWTMIVAEVGN